MQRTTVRLPDALIIRAKKKAAAEGKTLTALIEEGLRMVVRDTSEGDAILRKPLPVSSVADGLLPGIDLARSAELQKLLDDDVIRQAGLVKLR